MAESCPSPANSSDVEALFPAGSSPEIRTRRQSVLCGFRMTRQLMTGAIRQMLIQHYSDINNIADNFVHARLKRDGPYREPLRADTTEPEGPLQIESIGRWRPDADGNPLQLIIKPNKWDWVRLGIGDRTGEDAELGIEYYSGDIDGSHTIFAMAEDLGEAENLADETGSFFMEHAALILQELGLYRWSFVGLGEPFAVTDARETYAVPVVVAYVVRRSWSQQIEAPRFREFVLSASDTLAGA